MLRFKTKQVNIEKEQKTKKLSNENINFGQILIHFKISYY